MGTLGATPHQDLMAAAPATPSPGVGDDGVARALRQGRLHAVWSQARTFANGVRSCVILRPLSAQCEPQNLMGGTCLQLMHAHGHG